MNPIEIVTRGLFNLLGLDGSKTKNTTAPTNSSQPINARGQTNLFTKSGKTRNFTNPRQAAQLAPTLSPVRSGGASQATPPARPAGGFGQSPGQLSVFGRNPNAVPSGQFTAPSIPNSLAIGARTAGIPLLGPAAKALLGAGALYSVLEGFLPAKTADGTLDAQGIQPRQSYSGMEDMSGDPIRPEIPRGRPDPFAPIDYVPPQQSYTPAQQAPPPRKPTRKELTIKKYDDLRAQFNAGKITREQFTREGLKMHREFFNK